MLKRLLFGNFCLLANFITCFSVSVNKRPEGPGTLSFASYYGDHMVLQKAPFQATIWGYTAIKAGAMLELTISPPVNTYTAHVVPNPSGNGGIWSLKFPPMKGGPYSISATYANETIRIVDVLFGDVWLCSGQSNMQFTLYQGLNASTEIADAVNYPNIRLFTVAETQSTTPEMDLLQIEEKWSVASKDSVGHGAWSYFSAVCWLYGKYLYQKLGYPIGLVASTWGGTPIEAWSSTDALNVCNVTQDRKYKYQKYKSFNNDTAKWVNDFGRIAMPSAHSVLWNAMIHPLVNMTIYGAIWYQGEANAGHPDNYGCMFPAMIDDWRTKFYQGTMSGTDKTFPFGFVQLAPNRNGSSLIKGWPDIRWHQTADTGYVPNYRMPNVFMSVAMDLPDFTSPYGSVHPRDKQDVAARLATGGLVIAYGVEPASAYAMPKFSAYYIDIGYFTLRIEYDNSTTVLDIRSTEGFEVCCSRNNQSRCDGTDSIWMNAPLINNDTHSVTMLYKGNCSNQWVMGVRYEWRESPCATKACAVYNQGNNLPAPPVIELGLIGEKPNHFVSYKGEPVKLYKMYDTIV